MKQLKKVRTIDSERSSSMRNSPSPHLFSKPRKKGHKFPQISILKNKSSFILEKNPKNKKELIRSFSNIENLTTQESANNNNHLQKRYLDPSTPQIFSKTPKAKSKAKALNIKFKQIDMEIFEKRNIDREVEESEHNSKLSSERRQLIIEQERLHNENQLKYIEENKSEIVKKRSKKTMLVSELWNTSYSRQVQYMYYRSHGVSQKQVNLRKARSGWEKAKRQNQSLRGLAGKTYQHVFLSQYELDNIHDSLMIVNKESGEDNDMSINYDRDENDVQTGTVDEDSLSKNLGFSRYVEGKGYTGKVGGVHKPYLQKFERRKDSRFVIDTPKNQRLTPLSKFSKGVMHRRDNSKEIGNRSGRERERSFLGARSEISQKSHISDSRAANKNITDHIQALINDSQNIKKQLKVLIPNLHKSIHMKSFQNLNGPSSYRKTPDKGVKTKNSTTRDYLRLYPGGSSKTNLMVNLKLGDGSSKGDGGGSTFRSGIQKSNSGRKSNSFRVSNSQNRYKILKLIDICEEGLTKETMKKMEFVKLKGGARPGQQSKNPKNKDFDYKRAKRKANEEKRSILEELVPYLKKKIVEKREQESRGMVLVD